MDEWKKQAEERLNELLEIAKQENQLYDDHGSAIIGDRLQEPVYPLEE